jgi:fructose-1-phosphate kinase PfkB-like protein
MTKKNLTITEYAKTFDLSPHNVRNKVNSGELPAEKIRNKWIIQVDETEVSLNQKLNQPLNQELNPLLIKNLEQQIEDLKEQLAQKDVQIDQLLKQQDQHQQIIMSMNQNQKLLVESKRTWFQKLFGLNLEST